MKLRIAAALAISGTLFGQQFNGVMTGLKVNGRYWNALSIEARATYIIALAEGISEVISYMPQSCNCTFDAALDAMKSVSGGTTSSYLEMAEAVSDFYKDSTNRAVPVVKALTYVTLKTKGGTAKQLEELAAKLRNEANH